MTLKPESMSALKARSVVALEEAGEPENIVITASNSSGRHARQPRATLELNAKMVLSRLACIDCSASADVSGAVLLRVGSVSVTDARAAHNLRTSSKPW